MKITLVCKDCNKKFNRSLSKYKYQIKNGQVNFYCSKKCSETNYGIFKKGRKSIGRPDKLDVYSPFRRMLYNINGNKSIKKRGLKIDIDLEYLYLLWNLQNGICPISGISMELPRDSNTKRIIKFNSASIDRINNSLGYIKGNIRFVCLMANYCRNTFTDKEVIEFCKSVSNYNL